MLSLAIKIIKMQYTHMNIARVSVFIGKIVCFRSLIIKMLLAVYFSVIIGLVSGPDLHHVSLPELSFFCFPTKNR